MSEPQKATGAAFSPGPIQGEKAGGFEERFEEPEVEATDAAEETAPEVEAEEAAAEPEEQEAAPDDESEGDRIVREATERLQKEAAGQPQPQPSADVAFVQGQVQELKDQIRQMGRAQAQPEPEDGMDFSFLENEEVLGLLRDAQDDPKALARMQGVIAQHVLEAQGSKGAKALEDKVDGLLQSIQQQQRVTHSRQVFQAGLEAARGMGEVEKSLVQQFEQNRELDYLDAHMKAGGKQEDYQPRSILGLWLMGSDPSTKQPNAIFAGSPTLMQAGVQYLARQLRGGSSASTSGISTTGAAAPARGGQDNSEDGEPTPEQEILARIKKAARGSKRAKAFG